MPKEAINIDILLEKVIAGKIVMDRPLVIYRDENGAEFMAFQNSGLNVLLGFEGSGKTKFLTNLIIDYESDEILRSDLYGLQGSLY